LILTVILAFVSGHPSSKLQTTIFPASYVNFQTACPDTFYKMSHPLKKNNVEISVPEVVQPPPPLWKDVAGEPILMPSFRGSGHYYWGVRIYSGRLMYIPCQIYIPRRRRRFQWPRRQNQIFFNIIII